MAIFYFARRAPKLHYYIYPFYWKSAVEHDGHAFKMRDSVPSARYSPICNVLRQWKTSLIPTYRVYRLYDYYSFLIIIIIVIKKNIIVIIIIIIIIIIIVVIIIIIILL